MTDEALAARLARSPKPVRRIRTNAAPTLQALSAYSQLDGIAADELLDRAYRIKAVPDFCARLIRLAAKEPWHQSEFVEEQIYSGFFSCADESRMAAFHRAAWDDRPAIVEAFVDRRLVALGRRLIFEHYPDLMHELLRNQFAAKMAQRMSAPSGVNVSLALAANVKTAPSEVVSICSALTSSFRFIIKPLNRAKAETASTHAMQLTFIWISTI